MVLNDIEKFAKEFAHVRGMARAAGQGTSEAHDHAAEKRLLRALKRVKASKEEDTKLSLTISERSTEPCSFVHAHSF